MTSGTFERTDPVLKYVPRIPHIFAMLRQSFIETLSTSMNTADITTRMYHFNALKEFIDVTMLMCQANAFTAEFRSGLSQDLLQLPSLVRYESIEREVAITEQHRGLLAQLLVVSRDMALR